MARRKTLAIALACAFGAACGAARGGGLLTMEPGPVDFSGAIGGHSPDDGRMLQMLLPGSHAWFVTDEFPAGSYRISCDTPYVLARSTAGQPGAAFEDRVCRILEAPVVGPDFVATLRRIGYQYALSYPFRDPGSGRALIFWSDGGATRGMAPAHQGFARIAGMGWHDQFVPAARCDADAGGCVWRYFDHGDSFGAFINRFPSPDREAAARTFQQIGVDAAGKVVAGASIAIDSWLLGGETTADSAAAVGPVKSASEFSFDSQSFCWQPYRDGTLRSSVRTQNCLAGEFER
jgi:hypothetical protein